jgi:dihydropteroate synthase
MHMQKEPALMQRKPCYKDAVTEITAFLSAQTLEAESLGIAAESIIVDPGIGFGKKAAHNLDILRRLPEFKVIGKPLLIGTSRKSFIGQATGAAIDQRLPGTIASNVIALMRGAHIVRVHDVKEMKQALRITNEIVESPRISA